jgi:hypothetical protein
MEIESDRIKLNLYEEKDQLTATIYVNRKVFARLPTITLFFTENGNLSKIASKLDIALHLGNFRASVFMMMITLISGFDTNHLGRNAVYLDTIRLDDLIELLIQCTYYTNIDDEMKTSIRESIIHASKKRFNVIDVNDHSLPYLYDIEGNRRWLNQLPSDMTSDAYLPHVHELRYIQSQLKVPITRDIQEIFFLNYLNDRMAKGARLSKDSYVIGQGGSLPVLFLVNQRIITNDKYDTQSPFIRSPYAFFPRPKSKTLMPSYSLQKSGEVYEYGGSTRIRNRQFSSIIMQVHSFFALEVAEPDIYRYSIEEGEINRQVIGLNGKRAIAIALTEDPLADDVLFFIDSDNVLQSFVIEDYGTHEEFHHSELNMTGVIKISAQGKNALILHRNGSLWSYGPNDRGQRGLGLGKIAEDFTEIKPITGVIIDIMCCEDASMIQTTSGIFITNPETGLFELSYQSGFTYTGPMPVLPQEKELQEELPSLSKKRKINLSACHHCLLDYNSLFILEEAEEKKGRQFCSPSCQSHYHNMIKAVK